MLNLLTYESIKFGLVCFNLVLVKLNKARTINYLVSVQLDSVLVSLVPGTYYKIIIYKKNVIYTNIILIISVSLSSIPFLIRYFFP